MIKALKQLMQYDDNGCAVYDVSIIVKKNVMKKKAFSVKEFDEGLGKSKDRNKCK